MCAEKNRKIEYPKYGKEAPFTDPVMRCAGENGCGRLTLREYIHKEGHCECGNRRFAEVRNLSEKEHVAVREVWPDFAAVFEESPDAGGRI